MCEKSFLHVGVIDLWYMTERNIFWVFDGRQTTVNIERRSCLSQVMDSSQLTFVGYHEERPGGLYNRSMGTQRALRKCIERDERYTVSDHAEDYVQGLD